MKRGREEESDQLDMANCLMLLNKVGENEIKTNPSRDLNDHGAYKCKTCNRRFSSFQALGGHRASHKKTKLMVSDLSCHAHSSKLQRSTTRMHPCPICGHAFAIGQALGGHMRKHRVAAINNHALPVLKKSRDADDETLMNLCLDLNLAPPDQNHLNLNYKLINLHTPALKLNCFI
ncbi:zinc finger protein ZAT12-like [Lotus japonicus]|uniref:zinc finger protein ZAT12-like n=1 Tax=Lotus japonicus TaxID=34305 RepID=UPI002590D088|nr:zinc finger protein ZAT12-like [Lotus japonicus]